MKLEDKIIRDISKFENQINETPQFLIINYDIYASLIKDKNNSVIVNNGKLFFNDLRIIRTYDTSYFFIC